jgi:hypothetical protein
MASRIVGKGVSESIFPGREYEALYQVPEMAEKVKEWRNGVEGLSLSIAARGGGDGCWYIDLASTPQSGFRELLLRADDALASYLFPKSPSKVLYFTSDALTSVYAFKKIFPETEIHFVNTQSLHNYENFSRDESLIDGPVGYRDIDYSVVDRMEIGKGESTEYDFIQVAAWDVVYDIQLLSKCVDALASGGVLYVMSTNHSGKLYRDDVKLHPYFDIHNLLKKKDGYTYHNSDAYGFTVFTKK